MKYREVSFYSLMWNQTGRLNIPAWLQTTFIFGNMYLQKALKTKSKVVWTVIVSVNNFLK